MTRPTRERERRGEDLPADAAEEEMAGLWRALAQGASKGAREQAREKLIVQYTPLVRFVAGRVGAGLPPSVEQGDLVSYGMFGLIEAIERFEPTRQVRFEAYAVGRIRGAMLDALRALDWVPRSVRAKARELDRAMTKLQAGLRRDPTEEELASELGCTAEEVGRRLEATAGMSVLALEDLATVSAEDGSRTSLLDTLPDVTVPDPEEAVEAQAVREALHKAIQALPERDRKVVILYYLEGFTLARIGGVFGVTESRVSQIHSKAVMALRARMEDILGERAVG